MRTTKRHNYDPPSAPRQEIVEDCLFLTGIAKALHTRPEALPVMERAQLWHAFKLAVRSGKFRWPEDAPQAFLDKLAPIDRGLIGYSINTDAPELVTHEALLDHVKAAAAIPGEVTLHDSNADSLA